MIGKLKCKYIRQATNEDGNVELTFEVAPESRFAVYEVVRKIKELAGKGKLFLSAALSEYREKRSLNANAYMWVLLEKMAQVLHTDKDSLYLDMLGKYGVFTHIIAKPNVAERVMKEWRLTKNLGPVTVNGTEGIQLQCYFGSSTYNTKEMSRLIDGIVMECKDLGIETETPEELARMKAEWAA